MVNKIIRIKDKKDPKNEVFCVIIPMYLVEDYIFDVVSGIPKWINFIITIDDCSPDNTFSVVRNIRDERIVLIRHETNLGVGAALLTGYKKAHDLGGTIFIKMDGDGQMNPNYLEELILPIIIQEADFTKGNRFVDFKMLETMPTSRRFGNIGLSFLIKIASGYWNIFDPTNGFTAITADTYTRLNLEKIHPRYFFESSLLIELNIIGAVVIDVPIPAIYRGEISSLSIKRTLFEFPYLIFHGFLRRIILKYFIYDFSPGSLFITSGLLMIIFAILWGGFHWIKSIYSNIPATTGTVMIAVLPLILGFQLLLQAILFDVQNVPSRYRSR